MRCARHDKEKCEICFPPVQSSSSDDGFALGLATGIPTSAAGLLGAAIHNSFSDDSSYDSGSSVNCGSSDSGSSDCGGDF